MVAKGIKNVLLNTPKSREKAQPLEDKDSVKIKKGKLFKFFQDDFFNEKNSRNLKFSILFLLGGKILALTAPFLLKQGVDVVTKIAMTSMKT